ncbi:MAG: hypothetical protein AAGD35_14875 [Actinomycetota bacterium]
MNASTELYPSWLLRAANGDRGTEAAVILLSETELLVRLHHCIVVDAESGEAWFDWPMESRHAEQLSRDDRAVVLTAAALAAELQLTLRTRRRAATVAIHHLLA